MIAALDLDDSDKEYEEIICDTPPPTHDNAKARPPAPEMSHEGGEVAAGSAAGTAVGVSRNVGRRTRSAAGGSQASRPVTARSARTPGPIGGGQAFRATDARPAHSPRPHGTILSDMTLDALAYHYSTSRPAHPKFSPRPPNQPSPPWHRRGALTRPTLTRPPTAPQQQPTTPELGDTVVKLTAKAG